MAPGPGFVLARDFSGWGAVFGMEAAGKGKLSLIEQRLCKLSHESASPPPWQQLSPVIIDTFVFLREGDSSTRKKAMDAQEC